MENIFLVGIQTNVNQRKQKFLTQLKSRILTIKIGVIFFLYKNLFFFARLNRFLYYCYYITRFWYVGFNCIPHTRPLIDRP